MTQHPTLPHATPETVWAAFQETDRRMKETDRQMQETDRRMQETDRLMQETYLQMKETDRKMQETDRRMKELQKLVGSWTNNHGLFAEEYFINCFKRKKKNFFGEEYKELRSPVFFDNGQLKDEYDLVMYNHSSVAIVEVKYKAHINDIQIVIKKTETFRILFPDYKDYKIYLALASMSFYPELEQECLSQGIIVIKQVGGMVVIDDGRMKVF